MSIGDDEQHGEVAREERDIYTIIVAASLPVVFGFLIEGGSMDGGATISLVLAIVGVVGLVAGASTGIRALMKPRLPRATAIRDR